MALNDKFPTVRTRFAPSPTGFLHVGGLRTALYAFLFARKYRGQFILRIEDTDQARQVENATENLIQTLRWAGLEYDEGPIKGGDFGPYIQSERLEIYQKYVAELINTGHAYYCFCSAQRLEQVRERKIAAKLPPAYDRYCRNLDLQIAQERIHQNESYVVRMKVPLEGEIVFQDLIRGMIAISYKNVDDQVILKSDGFPTYHLAVVVDDHCMQISHVIRGEEWLSSTPKHLLLYQYFGWQAPQFAHLPLLLNPDKSKLSKRQGDVAVEDYMKKGFIKEALINFIALLGWNPGDTREIFSLDELVQEFSLERVGKSGAIFNLEKLKWINHKWLTEFGIEDLASLIKPFIKAKYPQANALEQETLLHLVKLVKKDLFTLQDGTDLIAFYFEAPTIDIQFLSSQFEHSKSIIDLIQVNLPIINSTEFLGQIKKMAKEQQIPLSQIFPILRYALSGRLDGFGVQELIEVLGNETSTQRFKRLKLDI